MYVLLVVVVLLLPIIAIFSDFLCLLMLVKIAFLAAFTSSKRILRPFSPSLKEVPGGTNFKGVRSDPVILGDHFKLPAVSRTVSCAT